MHGPGDPLNTTRFGTKKRAKETVPQRVKVQYRFHPLYKQEVEILYETVKGGNRYYLIVFIDTTHLFLPVWMTDPLICKHLTVRETPYCHLSALRNLRELLDQF